jgi:DNA (cytosine-5)-methyltransferase 1
MAYAIDLFCGAGGMSEGILQAGFQILFSSDINESVEKTYVNRHEQLGLRQGIETYYHRCDIKDLTGKIIYDKISKLKMFEGRTIPKIDAIFGGPPCQGFSRAGRRNCDDPRNMLFREYLRVINELKPNYVVLENVVGISDTRLNGYVGVTGVSYEDGLTVPEILNQEFELIGYNMLKPKILNAAKFGVPQRRNRFITIAHKKGTKAPSYPRPTHHEKDMVTVKDAIGDLILEKDVRNKINPTPSKFQLESQNGRTPDVNGNPIPCQKINNSKLSRHLPIIKERFSLFKEGEDGTKIKQRILSEGIDISNKPYLMDHIKDNTTFSGEEIIERFKKGDVDDKLIQLLLTKKNIRSRLDKNKPSPTIMTLPDDYISPFEDRIFSVRESARIQSFDDSFEFLGKRTTGGLRRRVEVPQYSQVGNAVPPLLAKAIACEILKVS